MCVDRGIHSKGSYGSFSNSCWFATIRERAGINTEGIYGVLDEPAARLSESSGLGSNPLKPTFSPTLYPDCKTKACYHNT